jgi:hypothetical protein
VSKIVVSEFISIDGAMEDPGGSEGSGPGAGRFSFSGARRVTGSSSTNRRQPIRCCSFAGRTKGFAAMRLMVFPIALGDTARSSPFRLLKVKAVGTDGVLVATYEQKRGRKRSPGG